MFPREEGISKVSIGSMTTISNVPLSLSVCVSLSVSVWLCVCACVRVVAHLKFSLNSDIFSLLFVIFNWEGIFSHTIMFQPHTGPPISSPLSKKVRCPTHYPRIGESEDYFTSDFIPWFIPFHVSFNCHLWKSMQSEPWNGPGLLASDPDAIAFDLLCPNSLPAPTPVANHILKLFLRQPSISVQQNHMKNDNF